MSSTEVKQDAGSAAQEPENTKKTSEDAYNLVAQGRRHILVKDIPSAVTALEESCRILAEEFGETAIELGEPYYLYGSALLEMARIESGVLGNAIEADTPETPEEKSDEDEATAGDENGSTEEAKPTEKADEEVQDEEEEDVSSLQLAWEILELAKVVYAKDTKDHTEKISQIYLKLGEVGMENESYDQSVSDFKACLELQKKVSQPDDRCIAETYYQLGVAYSYHDDFDAAIENFQSSSKVIKDRIANLLATSKEKLTWSEEQKKDYVATRKDPFYSEEKEIEELRTLLPEIEDKISDMEEVKKDSKEKMKKLKMAAFAGILGGSAASSGFGDANGSTSFAGSSSSSDSKLTNINHLVRKKRKPEDEQDSGKTKIAKMEIPEDKPTSQPVEQTSLEATDTSEMKTA